MAETLEIMQGDAYSIDVSLTNDNGDAITPSNSTEVEFALGTLIKKYPTDCTYADGEYSFPLTQQETFAMPIGLKTFQVRVKFDSDVVGANLPNVMVVGAKSKAVL